MPAAEALEEFCGSEFWNSTYLDRADPDLPVCLEQTVLVWIPLGFLWLLCGPRHLAALFRSTGGGGGTHLSRLYVCKQLIAALLFLTAMAGLAVTLGQDFGPGTDASATGRHAAVFYTNPALFAVSWLLLMLCQEGLRRREGAVDSATLFNFWLLLVVCEIFPFQTLLREALRQGGSVQDVPRFSLFYISFGLELVGLVLSAIADIPLEAEESIKKNPEVGAPFLSRITFSWLNRMVLKGYKQALVQEDMYELKKENTAERLSKRFQEVMRVELAAARVRFRKRQAKTQLLRDKEEKVLQNGLSSNGLAKGVSQDVLVMEEKRNKNKQETKKEEEEDYPDSWLIPTLYKSFRGVMLMSAFYKLLQDLLVFLSPQLLK